MWKFQVTNRKDSCDYSLQFQKIISQYRYTYQYHVFSRWWDKAKMYRLSLKFILFGAKKIDKSFERYSSIN